jgi:hypothetical protein
MFDWPLLPGLFELVVPAGFTCGSTFSAVSSVMSCLPTSSAAVTVVMGLLDCRSDFRMRLPVTTTRSVACCASAGLPTAMRAPPRAASTPYATWVLLNMGTGLL